MPRSNQNRLTHLEQALPPDIFRALRLSEPRVARRAPERSVIERELRSLGAPATTPVLDFLTLLSGVECRSLRVGLDLTRTVCDRLPTDTRRLTIPIGIGPSDAKFWIDAEGLVYDDTDLERCIPVGIGASGLLDYWLVQTDGYRWSGAVHGHIARIGGITPAELARLLDVPCGGTAVRDDLAVWPQQAPHVCDAVDQARRVFDTESALSSGDLQRWVGALLTVSDVHPELVIRLDLPHLPPSGLSPDEIVARRIRCLSMHNELRDGYLCVVREVDGMLTLRLDTDA